MLVAITGGRGKIGVELTKELKRRGYDYRTLSRTPLSESIPHEERKNHIVGTITDPIAVNNLVDGADCIIHLARTTHELNDICDVDLYSMKVLIPAMIEHNLEVIFTSSQAVHGSEHQYPHRRVTEDYPFEPDDPYGVMKLAWERMLFVYKCRNNLRYITYRFPYVFIDQIFTQYLEQGIRNGVIVPEDALHCWGGFSYVHVEHIVPTIVDNIGNKRAYGSEYMCCADTYMTYRKLARMSCDILIQERYKCKVEWPEREPDADNFTTLFDFDNSKAKRYLNFDASDSEELLRNKLFKWLKDTA